MILVYIILFKLEFSCGLKFMFGFCFEELVFVVWGWVGGGGEDSCFRNGKREIMKLNVFCF